GAEVRERDPAVEIFGERLQVNVGGIHVIVDVVKGVARDVAVRDHHGAQSVFFCGEANINHVFGPDGGFVVGESDGGAAVANREAHHVLRGNVGRMHLVGS